MLRISTIKSFMIILYLCQHININGQPYEVTKVILPTKIVSLDLQYNAKLSQFGFSPKLIQLETKPECLLSDQLSIGISDNYITIVDKKVRPFSAYLFGKNGHYIRKISNSGKGPFEFGYIYSCYLDEARQQMFIVDVSKNSLIVFNLEGKGIKEEKFPNISLGAKVISEKNRILITYQEIDNDGMHEGILFLDNTFKILEKLPIISREDPQVHGYHFYLNRILYFNNYLLFSSYPFQEIYRIDEARHSAHKWLEFDFKGSNNQELMNEGRELKYRIQNFQLFNNKMLITAVLNTYEQYFFYDFNNSKLNFVSPSEQFYDDLFFSGIIRIQTIVNGIAYLLQQPSEIIANTVRDMAPRSITSILGKIKDEDNPILFYYNMK